MTDYLTELVILTILGKEVETEIGPLRTQAKNDLKPSERRPVWVTVNGEDVCIGAVTKDRTTTTSPTPEARVIDENQFLSWVTKTDANMLTRTVADWARGELLRTAAAGIGEFFDPITGEQIDAPWGVAVEPGRKPSDPRVTVRVDQAGAEKIRPALRGRITATQHEIEGGASQ